MLFFCALCFAAYRAPRATRRSSALCRFRRNLHDLQDLHYLHDRDRREQALCPMLFFVPHSPLPLDNAACRLCYGYLLLPAAAESFI